jgi:hypothetical protein
LKANHNKETETPGVFSSLLVTAKQFRDPVAEFIYFLGNTDPEKHSYARVRQTPSR